MMTTEQKLYSYLRTIFFFQNCLLKFFPKKVHACRNTFRGRVRDFSALNRQKISLTQLNFSSYQGVTVVLPLHSTMSLANNISDSWLTPHDPLLEL